MRDGLKKGVETTKRNKKRYPVVCKVCGKIKYYTKGDAEKRQYCSPACAMKDGKWIKGVKNASIATHQRNLDRKQIIKKDIIKWVDKNVDLVLNCPRNKIRTTLSGLINLIEEKYDIKDWRSIFICFEDTKNMKTLLDRLQEIAYISKENVRRAGL